jgi:hypothetical protein
MNKICRVIIGKSKFFVQGGNPDKLKQIADILDMPFDKIVRVAIPINPDVIKVWAIGELADHLRETG